MKQKEFTNPQFVRRLTGRLMLLAGCALLPVSAATAYVVDIHQTVTTGIGSLAAADAIIAAPASLQASANASIIEFDDLGDGTRGLFSVNNPFPGGFISSFVAHVTGFFSIATGGTHTFGINHDDGARLMIDGALWASADGVFDNRSTENSALLSAGLHSVDIVFFENFGGASLEFYTRDSTGAVSLVQSAAVPEPAVLALVALGLAGLGLGTRRRRIH